MRFRIPSLMLAAAVGLAMTAGTATMADAKGGHGRGHGHGFKVGHYKVHKWHHTPRGWSMGRKVGWRGHHVPPGHMRW